MILNIQNIQEEMMVLQKVEEGILKALPNKTNCQWEDQINDLNGNQRFL